MWVRRPFEAGLDRELRYHFDRLVREGVMFRNAHCAAPSCSASRAAMLTGQWPWRLERGANLWSSLPPKFDSYPDLLEKSGYFIGSTGKGYGPGNNAGRPHNAAGPAFKSFAAFLAERPKDKPFCFWFGSHQPHRAYPRDCGVKHGLDPAKVKVRRIDNSHSDFFWTRPDEPVIESRHPKMPPPTFEDWR